MNCRELSQFLMEYVDQTLEREVYVTFEAHLNGCQNCHTYVIQYRETIRAGQLACQDDDVSDLPEDLVQAVLIAISREPRS
jgi:predicted anti-sigma-YlaC factor YlaD